MGHNLPIINGPPKQSHVKQLGGALKKDFPFDPEWLNLNHGSFGSIPNAMCARLRHYQDATEARPDQFIRYDYPRLLDESRAAVADLVNAPVETVVFVTNATDGVNTVFRNLTWAEDGKDVILTFSTVYEACANVADFIVDYYNGEIEHRPIPISYPLEDDEILEAFRDAVRRVEADGKRARVCIFDVVSSRPGVLFPWVDVTKACKELGVISMVDGAQGIGMVPLDLTAADPDYFVSNCHKWLHVPRGCAVFYVPLRNQHLLPTTLATSNGYIAKSSPRGSPLPPSAKGVFVNNFEFMGTKDNGPFLCVKDAIAWRRDVLGGEDRILAYLWDLNKRGSLHVAGALGTEILENSKGTLTNCSMGNVALPIWIGEKGENARDSDALVADKDAGTVFQWIARTMVDDYKTFMSLFVLNNRFWVRISAQVYLDMRDYEVAANVLKELSARVSAKWG
ncbi:aminotransferase class-V domain-containing protein [Hirsutella rhossiliensis]|uniref:Aminotransferase class-V domain-containing protein n=1 Tax=Hirsutella rhossiliensis TaxID=111463 RepID=A0A9P8N720_9HYPO|nr:aminotransferase class-V domain-containing protein [Hirsutella rhossiliensis]KAH0967717.1 aminotransferase class-V domain-containing protein [Hirsutella rhossiliensis]